MVNKLFYECLYNRRNVIDDPALDTRPGFESLYQLLPKECAAVIHNEPDKFRAEVQTLANDIGRIRVYLKEANDADG
jgi:hypothetical protein